jgi:hypothetical protein
VSIWVPPQTQPDNGQGTTAARARVWADVGFAPWVEPAYRRFRLLLPGALSVLGAYIAARAILLVGAVFAAHLNYGSHVLWPMSDWDGNWYLQVAQTFYPSHLLSLHGQLTYNAAGFEPVFPALIRFFTFFGMTFAQSALFVSLVGGAAATLLVWRLGTVLVDEEVGRIAGILFAVFPGMAVAWGLFYCECVGLAFAAGCLLLLLRERWIWAGVVGALATATSPMAVPLVLPAGVAAYQAIRRRGRHGVGALGAVAIVPAGFVAYAGAIGIRYHDIFFWWHLQKQAWTAKIDFGSSLVNLLWHPFTGGFQGKGWMEWVGVVAVAFAVYALSRAKLPAIVNVYCGGVFVLMFVSNSLGFKPRFLAWAFPALIAVAVVTRRRGWRPIALFFAGLMPFVFLAYTLNGNYIIQP